MIKNALLSVVAFVVGLVSGASQTFQNLGFESAVISGPPGIVEWNAAMPGWTGTIGGTPAPFLSYNSECLSACTSIGIVDAPGFSSAGPIVGRYSVFLSAGFDLGNRYESSIAQSGLVPPNAQSVRFLGRARGPEAPIVSLGGQVLELHVLGHLADVTAYGADVSAFAGQTAELRFTVASDYTTILQQGGSQLMLDSILFAATPVPEPSVIALLVLGGCILARWKITGRKPWFLP